MDYRQSTEYIAAFPAIPGGENTPAEMLRLLDALGNPQRGLRCVHVAGTNGKGSVCAYLSHALAQSGYRTGLFTSPYLVRVNERIQINGEPIPDEAFAGAVTAVRAAYEQGGFCLPCFALLTAAMFLYFRDRQVDIAVIEVGLGGRLDPTNVCEPLVSVITSIGMDHARQLGDTPEKIAREKAGIIKNGVPVVAAPNPPEVMAVIRAVCAQKGAPFKCLSSDRAVIRANLSETVFAYRNEVYQTKLAGRHQVINACVALEALRLLRAKGFPARQIRRSLAQTEWPGRLQTLCRDPLILLDGAHNPPGARVLADFAEAVGKRFVLVAAVSADKDIPGICAELARAADPAASPAVYACAYSGARAEGPDRLAEAFEHAGLSAKAMPSFEAALRAAMGQNRPILICGSLYLAGEALRFFQGGGPERGMRDA